MMFPGVGFAHAGSGVVGPASSVTGHLAVFANATGTLLEDGGAPASGGGTGDVVGPSSAASGEYALFNGTSGKLIAGGALKQITAGDGNPRLIEGGGLPLHLGGGDGRALGTVTADVMSLQSSGGVGIVSHIAAAGLTGPQGCTYSWPADGNPGDKLTTDGAGNLSWSASGVPAYGAAGHVTDYSQNISDSSETQLVLTTDYDNDSILSSNTFNIQHAGRYLVTLYVSWSAESSAPAGERRASIVFKGSTVAIVNELSVYPDNTFQCVTCVVNADAADAIYGSVYQNTGGLLAVNGVISVNYLGPKI